MPFHSVGSTSLVLAQLSFRLFPCVSKITANNSWQFIILVSVWQRVCSDRANTFGYLSIIKQSLWPERMKRLKSVKGSPLELGRSGTKAPYWEIQSFIRRSKGEPGSWAGCQQMRTVMTFQDIFCQPAKKSRRAGLGQLSPSSHFQNLLCQLGPEEYLAVEELNGQEEDKCGREISSFATLK